MKRKKQKESKSNSLPHDIYIILQMLKTYYISSSRNHSLSHEYRTIVTYFN